MTGFLDYNTYLDLLPKVEVIMDLTTDDKTMLAGAYKAVALEQPLITSDWMPLRRYFNRDTIYINNSPEDIRESIMLTIKKKRNYQNKCISLSLKR
jgi:hypothetical protein